MTDRDPTARARCLALLLSLRDLGREASIFEDGGPTVMVADRQLRPTRKPGVPDAWRVYCDRHDEPWVCAAADVLEDKP